MRLDERSLNGGQLERWLVAEGFATERDGLLIPTERTAALEWALSLLVVADV